MQSRPFRIFAAAGLVAGATIAAFAAFGFTLERPDNPLLGKVGWAALFELGLGVTIAAAVVWRRSARLAPKVPQLNREVRRPD